MPLLLFFACAPNEATTTSTPSSDPCPADAVALVDEVPHLTLEDAAADAVGGGTLLLCAGTHEDPLDIRDLLGDLTIGTLSGEPDVELRARDLDDDPYPALYVRSTEGAAVTVRDLTIVEAPEGVVIQGRSVVLEGLVLRQSLGRNNSKALVVSAEEDVLLSQVVVENNTLPDAFGSVVQVRGAEVLVQGSTFESNEAPFGALGLFWLNEGAEVVIETSDFVGNVGSGIGWIHDYADTTLTLRDVRLIGTSGPAVRADSWGKVYIDGGVIEANAGGYAIETEKGVDVEGVAVSISDNDRGLIAGYDCERYDEGVVSFYYSGSYEMCL